MTPEDLENKLNEWLDRFDFTRPGLDQSLGRDVAMKTVDRIIDRSEQKRSITEDWPANAPKYAKWKEKKYDVAECRTSAPAACSARSRFMAARRSTRS